MAEGGLPRFRFRHFGVQVLCNGNHVADAVSEEWAHVLTAMLNRDANRSDQQQSVMVTGVK
jgi:hypothetical protein